jgi:hypothetical protein
MEPVRVRRAPICALIAAFAVNPLCVLRASVLKTHPPSKNLCATAPQRAIYSLVSQKQHVVIDSFSEL